MKELLTDLWAFTRERRSVVLGVLLTIFLVMAALALIGEYSAVAAPFIYTLF